MRCYKISGDFKICDEILEQVEWVGSKIKFEQVNIYVNISWHEDEIVGWHHWFNGRELGQTPGDAERQGNLVCSSPMGSRRVWYNLGTEKRQQHLYI